MVRVEREKCYTLTVQEYRETELQSERTPGQSNTNNTKNKNLFISLSVSFLYCSILPNQNNDDNKKVNKCLLIY